MSSRPKFTATTGRFKVNDEQFDKEFRRYKFDPKKLSWIQRNPRKFVKYFTTACLLVFFSKPIYDLTIGRYFYDPTKPKRQPPPFYTSPIKYSFAGTPSETKQQEN